MSRLKLLVAGLLASALGIMLFASTLTTLNPNINVLALALNNPNGILPRTLSTHSRDNPDVGSNVTGTITSTLNLTGTNKIAEAITTYFSGTLTSTVSVSDVLALHDQGWGFGEIFKLYELAKESGKTPTDIEALRDGGMGWGEIAKSLGLSPGNKGNNLGAAVSGHSANETQSTNSPNNGNSQRNPHGGPPGQSGGGGPPAGKGNSKGK